LKIFQWTVGTIIVFLLLLLLIQIRAKLSKDKAALYQDKIKVVIAKIDIGFPKKLLEGYTEG
jgi:hypothetical protein